MQKNWSVHIYWTNWLELDDKLWLERDAVYMFATKSKSLYIGRAGDHTVRQRFCSHNKESKLLEIADCAGRYRWGLWIGIIEKEKGIRSIELLADIESLLIYSESLRNNCKANNKNAKSRGKYNRPDMHIINHGGFQPLLSNYYDSKEFFDEL